MEWVLLAGETLGAEVEGALLTVEENPEVVFGVASRLLALVT